MFPLKCVLLWAIILQSCTRRVLAMSCEDICDSICNDSGDTLEIKETCRELNKIMNRIGDMSLRLKMPKAKPQELRIFDIRYDSLPEICRQSPTPRNCAEATACTRRSGYYRIHMNVFSNGTFLALCDAHTEGGDWTVIQRRHDGSEDFYRSWSEYKDGFGDLNGEFFIGMEKLYVLTNFDGPQELLILMENSTNSHKVQPKYDAFSIDNESQKYKLKSLGRFTGNATDSLRWHLGGKFSTKDQDNDEYLDGSCAVNHVGAWWYKHCHKSNLNGHYDDLGYAKGVNWLGVTTYFSSLEYVEMMIRRRHS